MRWISQHVREKSSSTVILLSLDIFENTPPLVMEDLRKSNEKVYINLNPVSESSARFLRAWENETHFSAPPPTLRSRAKREKIFNLPGFIAGFPFEKDR